LFLISILFIVEFTAAIIVFVKGDDIIQQVINDSNSQV